MPFHGVSPRLIYERFTLGDEERLPDDVIEFIHAADTSYLSTSYVAAQEDENAHPSRVGTNHRGGRPGFIRVRPSDGKTLVLPNYAGKNDTPQGESSIYTQYRESRDELAG